MATAVNVRPRPKHVPQRTCVACRSITAKRDLIRLVRRPEGQVEVDTTGKGPGRGAYLCRNPGCWELALKKSRLEAALKANLTPEDRTSLLQHSRTLAPIASDG